MWCHFYLLLWALLVASVNCGPMLLKWMDPCVAATMHVNGYNHEKGQWSANIGDLHAVISHEGGEGDVLSDDPGKWQAAIYHRAKGCKEIDVTGQATMLPMTTPEIPQPSEAEISGQQTTTDYPVDDGYQRGHSSSFKFYPVHMMWDDAEQACVADGAHLAVTTHPNDVDVLMKLFEPYVLEEPRRFYEARLQFQKYSVYGSFQTIDGKKISDFPYLNWAHGEPSNTNDDENCMSIYPDGTLNDLPCDTGVAFFCEKYSHTLQQH